MTPILSINDNCINLSNFEFYYDMSENENLDMFLSQEEFSIFFNYDTEYKFIGITIPLNTFKYCCPEDKQIGIDKAVEIVYGIYNYLISTITI